MSKLGWVGLIIGGLLSNVEYVTKKSSLHSTELLCKVETNFNQFLIDNEVHVNLLN